MLENSFFTNSLLAYIAWLTVAYSIKINPNPFTLVGANYKLIVSWGLGMTTLTTYPNLFAISVTSPRIYLYYSSIPNYSIETICLRIIILLGGTTILSSTGGSSSFPRAWTFFRIVYKFLSVPISDNNCLLYSMYCFGLPNFSWYPNNDAPFNVNPLVAYCDDLNSTNA